MGHLSFDQLDDMIKVAARDVTVGGTYRHYKGQTYTVTGLAILEATNEPAVIYRASYDERLAFVRALSVWQETVEVDGKSVPRFQLVV